MKSIGKLTLATLCCLLYCITLSAQQRRPIDAQHPMWLVHVDVWNKADPQKIINLIPEDLRPFVVMNLSLSCQYDKDKNVYKMPQNAIRTYKSWATICQAMACGSLASLPAADIPTSRTTTLRRLSISTSGTPISSDGIMLSNFGDLTRLVTEVRVVRLVALPFLPSLSAWLMSMAVSLPSLSVATSGVIRSIHWA